jgi:hypothetical protein
MAQTPEEKAAAKAAKDAEKAAAKAAESVEAVTVKYRDHNGETVERTFSQEVHGDEFAKLADEFKATNASKLIS